jgi:hypothetical protein
MVRITGPNGSVTDVMAGATVDVDASEDEDDGDWGD